MTGVTREGAPLPSTPTDRPVSNPHLTYALGGGGIYAFGKENGCFPEAAGNPASPFREALMSCGGGRSLASSPT